MVFSGARQWVYAQSVRGKFERIHRYLGYVQLALMFALPLVPIKGHPALQIDLPARRLYAFGAAYTPADTEFLLILLLLAAFSLFFFTSLYGRLWCGYACPQTVFLEQIARPIERIVEGKRITRMRRDERARGTWDWWWRKLAKFALFAAASWALGVAMVAFFSGPGIWWGQGGPSEYAFSGTLAFFLFWDFAWFREQFCNYVCPYARFQGVMCDDESLVVAYDEPRGEPRGREQAPLGGCIDCGKCVHVCPAGIDIRDGFQLECITCGRCIDACQTVMDKLGHDNLIRYSTIAETEGRPVRLLRPRTAVYGGLLAVLTAALVVVLLERHTIEASVNRLPGPAFTVDADGFVRNTYMLRVANNDTDPGQDHFTVKVLGLDGAEVTVPDITLGPTETRTVPLVVRLPLHKAAERTLPIVVTLTNEHDTIEVHTTFKSAKEFGS